MICSSIFITETVTISQLKNFKYFQIVTKFRTVCLPPNSCKTHAFDVGMYWKFKDKVNHHTDLRLHRFIGWVHPSFLLVALSGLFSLSIRTSFRPPESKVLSSISVAVEFLSLPSSVRPSPTEVYVVFCSLHRPTLKTPGSPPQD